MGGGSPSSTTTQKFEPSPEQRELMSFMIPLARRYSESQPSIHEGSAVADFTPAQLAAQQYAAGVSAPTAAQLGGGAASAQMQALDPNFMMNNPHLAGVMGDIREEGGEKFLRQIDPAIRRQGQAAGGVYSSGDRPEIARGLAAQGVGKEVSRALADLAFKAHGQGMSGWLQALQGNKDIMAQQLLPAQMLAQVGGEQQANIQAKMTEALQKFYDEQNLDVIQAGNIGQLLGMTPGGTSSASTSGGGGGFSPMQGLGMGMSLLGGMK